MGPAIAVAPAGSAARFGNALRPSQRAPATSMDPLAQRRGRPAGSAWLASRLRGERRHRFGERREAPVQERPSQAPRGGPEELLRPRPPVRGLRHRPRSACASPCRRAAAPRPHAAPGDAARPRACATVHPSTRAWRGRRGEEPCCANSTSPALRNPPEKLDVSNAQLQPHQRAADPSPPQPSSCCLHRHRRQPRLRKPRRRPRRLCPAPEPRAARGRAARMAVNGSYYGRERFDPLLILAQIVILQACFYASYVSAAPAAPPCPPRPPHLRTDQPDLSLPYSSRCSCSSTARRARRRR